MNRSLLSDETPLVRSFVEACFSVGDESWREMGRSVCDSLMAEKGENWEKNAVFVLRVSFEKECYGGGERSCVIASVECELVRTVLPTCRCAPGIAK